MIWIHKYLILRGSWKSWEEITRTSEWVWKWGTGTDQPYENLFVKHSKVRKKKGWDFLVIILQLSSAIGPSSSCVQLLCWRIHLQLYPNQQHQLSSTKVNLVFMWTQVILQPFWVSQGQNAQKLLQKYGEGEREKIMRYYRQGKEGSKHLARRPAYCCWGRSKRSQNFLWKRMFPTSSTTSHIHWMIPMPSQFRFLC